MKKFTDGFFSIDSVNGFLPLKEPLLTLPYNYIHLQKLIDEMPIKKPNGQPGLLSAKNQFEKFALLLPNYLNKIKSENDVFLLAALFRAYSFISSGYTLSASYHTFLKTGQYGKAKNLLQKI